MNSRFTDEEIERLQEIMDTIPDYFDDVDEIVCPHCGENQDYESADTGLYTENTIEETCIECGEKFLIFGSMSWNWSTQKS